MEAGSSPEPLGFLFENPVPDLSLRGPEEREARCGPASRTANGEQDHAPILWRTKRIPFSDPEAPRKPAAPESRKPLSGTNLFPARRTSPSKAGPPPPPIPPAAHPALRPVEAAKPGRAIIPKPCRRAAACRGPQDFASSSSCGMGILPMSCWIATQGQDAHATVCFPQSKPPVVFPDVS
jgi:hypothetical protein